MKQKTTAVLSAAALVLGVAGTTQAGTLEDVQSQGVLRCVVSTGIAGFAQPDASGVWKGFDIDFCRATAAAVLGDGSRNRAGGGHQHAGVEEDDSDKRNTRPSGPAFDDGHGCELNSIKW